MSNINLRDDLITNLIALKPYGYRVFICGQNNAAFGFIHDPNLNRTLYVENKGFYGFSFSYVLKPSQALGTGVMCAGWFGGGQGFKYGWVDFNHTSRAWPIKEFKPRNIKTMFNLMKKTLTPYIQPKKLQNPDSYFYPDIETLIQNQNYNSQEL